MEQNRAHTPKPHTFTCNWFSTVMPRYFNAERIFFSTQVAETIEYPHGKKKKKEPWPLGHTIYRSQLEMDDRLDNKLKTLVRPLWQAGWHLLRRANVVTTWPSNATSKQMFGEMKTRIQHKNTYIRAHNSTLHGSLKAHNPNVHQLENR